MPASGLERHNAGNHPLGIRQHGVIRLRGRPFDSTRHGAGEQIGASAHLDGFDFVDKHAQPLGGGDLLVIFDPSDLIAVGVDHDNRRIRHTAVDGRRILRVDGEVRRRTVRGDLHEDIVVRRDDATLGVHQPLVLKALGVLVGDLLRRPVANAVRGPVCGIPQPRPHRMSVAIREVERGKIVSLLGDIVLETVLDQHVALQRLAMRAPPRTRKEHKRVLAFRLGFRKGAFVVERPLPCVDLAPLRHNCRWTEVVRI